MSTRIYIKCESDELMRPTIGTVTHIIPDTERLLDFKPPEYYSVLIPNVSPRQMKSVIDKKIDVNSFYDSRCGCCGAAELFMSLEQFSRGVVD